MKGRKPKPNELKRLEGNPGRRPLPPDAAQAAGRPSKPDYVQGYAAEVWHRLVGSMPEKVYTAADQELLAAYCVAADLHRQASENIAAMGAVISDELGAMKTNPHLRVLNGQATKMASIGSRLGIDPAARSSLRVPQDEKVRSKFEGLIGLLPVPWTPS